MSNRQKSVRTLEFVLSGTIDPSAQALDAKKGTLYLDLNAGNIYQKQDNGLSTNWTPKGSGAAGFLGVLGQDPAQPNVNDWWYLFTAAVDPTSVTASIASQTVVIDISVPNPTIADLLALGGGTALGLITWANQGQGVNVQTNNGTISIDYEGAATTIQDMINAINAFSQGLIGEDIAALAQGATAGNNFAADLGQEADDQAQVVEDSTPSVTKLKLETNDGTKEVSLA